jgi:VanZ family protein
MLFFVNILRSWLAKPYLAIFVSLIVCYLCLTPSVSLPNVTGDKTAHFTAFCSLGFLWFFCSKSLIRPFGGLLVFGVFIEIVQHFLPESFHRGFEWFDILADWVGTGLGLFTYWLADLFLKYIEKRSSSI